MPRATGFIITFCTLRIFFVVYLAPHACLDKSRTQAKFNLSKRKNAWTTETCHSIRQYIIAVLLNTTKTRHVDNNLN